MATIQDILLYQAQQDAAARDDVTDAQLVGGVAGGLIGASIGELDHEGSKLMQRAKNMVRGVETPEPSMLSRVRPGMRMAGGLVGAILGGALGAGAKQQLLRDSPSAELLAKLQTDGELSANDQQALQNVLANTYSTTLAM